MCRVRRLLRTLCLELTRLCHKYHHQRIRDHQNGTDAGLGFWVIGLPDFFCIFVRFCCEQAYKSNRFRTYPALRVLPGGNQVDGLPPVAINRENLLHADSPYRYLLQVKESRKSKWQPTVNRQPGFRRGGLDRLLSLISH